ncbi:hypothetical protein TNCV_2738701 [Trichonephila clavipes]|nr:hypothetical protein TNCV_2738701 [Trichonephila clavipes]
MVLCLVTVYIVGVNEVGGIGEVYRRAQAGNRLNLFDGGSVNEHFYERFLCSDNEHIFGFDQGDTSEIMYEILTTARDLELEVNEDDIEELIMGHEDELRVEELQEILNEEHQET